MLTLTQAQFNMITSAMQATIEQVLEDHNVENYESLARKCANNLHYFFNPDEVKIDR